MESAIKGDIDSFGELCRTLYAPMVAVTYGVLTDFHLAEDAVQEAYARALVKLPDLRRPGRFTSWLARICRNVALDMGREKSRYRNSESMPNLAAEGKKVEGEVGPALQRAIAKLPTVGRELIVLRYYNNMSYRQMSEVTGLSEAAINTRLKRIRDKIAERLRQEKISEDWS